VSAPYNPDSALDRRVLGQALLAAFASKGFTVLPSREGTETVVVRSVEFMPRVEVRVYTSVVNGAVRALGKDAIRATAVYTTTEGQVRGLASDARVFRTGTVDAIVERAVQRARDVYGAVRAVARCRCGSPMFTAKSGKVVCAEACWTRRDTPVHVPAPPPPPPPAPPAAVVPAPCLDGWEHYTSKVTSDEPGGTR